MRRFRLFITTILFLVPFTKQAAAQGSQVVNNGAATTAIGFPGAGCYYSWLNDTPGIGLAASGAESIPSFTAVNTGSSPVTATITATLVPPAAYIANAGDNTVSVITTANGKVVATIKVGDSPIGVSVSPDGGRVYVAGGGSPGVVSVINTAANTVVATIQLADVSNNVLVSPDGSKVYVTTNNDLTVISTATNSIIASIALASPFGMAISPDGNTLYVTTQGGNSVFVVNTQTDKVTATIPVGSDAVLDAVSPDGSRLYVVNYSSASVSVINTATNLVIATVPVGPSPFGIAITPDGSMVYVGNAGANNVSAISTSTNTVQSTISYGTGVLAEPYGLCVSPDGTQLYIANANANQVTVLDTKTNAVITTVAVGLGPNSHGNFITGGSGCSNTPVKFTITVNPAASAPPSITAGTATGTISACAGTDSASPNIQQFTISGSGLTAAVTVTAPPDFEVSLTAGSNYANSMTLTETSVLANTTIYVRSGSAAPAGNISGNVIISSPGATSENVAVTGTINSLPTVNAVPPQTVSNGTATTAINFTGTGNTYTWVNNTPGIGLPASGTGSIPSFTAINIGSNSITASITVMPAGPSLAYITNSGSSTVSVINTANNSVIATIPVGSVPSGVALSPDGSWAYIGNGNSKNVSVINTSTNTVVSTIALGSQPFGLTVSSDGSRLYVSTTAGTVIVINTSGNTVIATIPVGSQPDGICINPSSGLLYVANNQSNNISVVNTVSNTVVTTIPDGGGPADVAISPDGSLLYVTNYNSNNVWVINTANNVLVATIPVGTNPNRIALSPDGSVAYVANYGGADISVINTTTNMVISSIPAGNGPMGVSVSPDGSELYVTRYASAVLVVSTATNSTLATIQVGSNPASFGNFITPGTGCIGTPYTFIITVNPAAATQPSITAGLVTGNITACVGTASASPNLQQFTVSGSNLIADITATAQPGFEISLNPEAGFGATADIVETGGEVKTIVFVRSSATANAGVSYSNVLLTSTGAASQSVSVSSLVSAFPTMNNPGNQSLNAGSVTAGINFTGTGNTFDWTNDTPSIGLAASGTGNIGSFTAVNAGSTPVTATITVTPKNSGYAYIANGGSNTVSVINTGTNQVVATIPVGNSPYAVAVSPHGDWVYVTNSLDNTVSIIDGYTNKVSYTVPVGIDPVSLSVSPSGGMLYVANEASNTVSVINTVTHTVVNTITAGNYPVCVLVSPDGSRLYVDNQNDHTISVFNTITYALIYTLPVPRYTPAQMAISGDGSTLYVAALDNGGSFLVINTTTYAYVITGSLSVSSFTQGIALTADGSKIYAESTELSVINTATDSLLATIPVGAGPEGVAITSDGGFVYEVNGAIGSVSVISTATNQVTATIPVGEGPISIGNFIGPDSRCPGAPVSFTITVAASTSPLITAGPVTGSITACAGAASANPDIQQFTVSGLNLLADITATAPTGFEISLNASSGFGATADIPETGGKVTNVIVYVRSSATAPAGGPSGNVVLSSTGAPSQNVAVTGTVNAPEAPSVSIVASANNVCAGSPLTFTATPTNGGSLPVYQWLLNGNNTGTNSATFGGSDFANGDIVSCTITSNAACATPVSATSNAITVKVTTPVTPSVNISASTNNICAGTPVTFTAVPANGGSTPVYQWLLNGNSTGTGDAEFTGNTLANGDIVTCMMTSSALCAVPVSVTSNSIVITVNPAPTVNAGGNKTIQEGNSTSLNATATGNISDITWSPPAGLSNNKILNPVASPFSTTTYTLTVQATDGCVGVDSLTVHVLAPTIIIPNTFTPNGDGINDTWVIKYLDFYPQCTVQIFTRWGQSVYSSIGYGTPWDGTYRGAALPSGTYYYVINLKNNTQLLSGFVAIIR